MGLNIKNTAYQNFKGWILSLFSLIWWVMQDEDSTHLWLASKHISAPCRRVTFPRAPSCIARSPFPQTLDSWAQKTKGRPLTTEKDISQRTALRADLCYWATSAYMSHINRLKRIFVTSRFWGAKGEELSLCRLCVLFPCVGY